MNKFLITLLWLYTRPLEAVFAIYQWSENQWDNGWESKDGRQHPMQRAYALLNVRRPEDADQYDPSADAYVLRRAALSVGAVFMPVALIAFVWLLSPTAMDLAHHFSHYIQTCVAGWQK